MQDAIMKLKKLIEYHAPNSLGGAQSPPTILCTWNKSLRSLVTIPFHLLVIKNILTLSKITCDPLGYQ